MIPYRAWIFLAALPAVAFGADLAFEIPPVPVTLNVGGQPVTLTISGNIAKSPPFDLKLRANLADFQNRLTPLMQAELNQSNRCGERIAIENATLVPAAPAGRLTVQLHFEKWVCIKAFGKENAKRVLGGNGTVEVMLTPRVEEGNTLHLEAEMGKIDADGSLGEALRSGSLGAELRDKIREALLKAIQKAAILDAVIPAQARTLITIQSVAFVDAGSGHLALDMAGRLRVSESQVSSVLEEFRNHK